MNDNSQLVLSFEPRPFAVTEPGAFIAMVLPPK